MKTPLPLALLLLLPGAGALRAETVDPGDVMDIGPVKDKLKVLSDGKKHYMILVPFEISDDYLFYGDGKTFYRQRTFGGGADGSESFSRVYWEPRVNAPYQAGIDFRNGKYEVTCDSRKTELKPLPDAEAKAILDGAKFLKPRWKYRAYALARDDRGVYYYVDKIRDPEASKSFRLFSGPKGKLRPLKMTNVVSDSEGDVFATKTGELRLVLNKSESQWISGKKPTRLLLVPVEDNHVLIYTDLGVYTGQPLGTACDDL